MTKAAQIFLVLIAPTMVWLQPALKCKVQGQSQVNPQMSNKLHQPLKSVSMLSTMSNYILLLRLNRSFNTSIKLSKADNNLLGSLQLEDISSRLELNRISFSFTYLTYHSW
jgi:hypothetical protein